MLQFGDTAQKQSETNWNYSKFIWLCIRKLSSVKKMINERVNPCIFGILPLVLEIFIYLDILYFWVQIPGRLRYF